MADTTTPTTPTTPTDPTPPTGPPPGLVNSCATAGTVVGQGAPPPIGRSPCTGSAGSQCCAITSSGNWPRCCCTPIPCGVPPVATAVPVTLWPKSDYVLWRPCGVCTQTQGCDGRPPEMVSKKLTITFSGLPKVFGTWDGVPIPIDWDPSSGDGSDPAAPPAWKACIASSESWHCYATGPRKIDFGGYPCSGIFGYFLTGYTHTEPYPSALVEIRNGSCTFLNCYAAGCGTGGVPDCHGYSPTSRFGPNDATIDAAGPGGDLFCEIDNGGCTGPLYYRGWARGVSIPCPSLCAPTYGVATGDVSDGYSLTDATVCPGRDGPAIVTVVVAERS